MKKKKELYIEGIAQFKADEEAIEEAKRLAWELEQQQQLEQAKTKAKPPKKNKKKKK